MPVFGVIGSEAEVRGLHPVEGAGSMALKAAVLESDRGGDR